MYSINSKIDVKETSVTLYRLTYLFHPWSFNLLDKNNIHEAHYYSVLVEILIHQRDLLQKLILLGNRVSFTDEIEQLIPGKTIDITDLIKYFRDAACHNDSLNRRNKKGYLFAGNIFAGDIYADDISLLMGDSRLFVKRHLFKLYSELFHRFSKYPEFIANEDFNNALKNAKAQGYYP